MECDGNTVTVRCVADANEPAAGDWDADTICFTGDGFTGILSGKLGFTAGNVYVDDLTVETWDTDADDWVTQLVEDFDANGSYADHRPAHDPAGNLVYDGVHVLTYDAWGRLAGVARAYPDADGALQTGSTIGTMEYDGLNRRTRKMVANSGDLDCTQEYLWDRDWRLLEVRNGSGDVLKQQLWGARYIDELVQIAINTDPADAGEDVCDANYYPMQNANFNVLGLADANGALVERYEYTPYGQRTVFTKAGINDALTTAPLYHSKRVVTDDGLTQPYGLCEFGHQGLMHDNEFELVYVRNRYLQARTGRWTQRDIIDYPDGMSLYEYVRSDPICLIDAMGVETKKRVSGLYSLTRVGTKRRAKVTAKQTFQADILSAPLGLSKTDINRWLLDANGRPAGPRLKACHTYTIPNLVIIQEADANIPDGIEGIKYRQQRNFLEGAFLFPAMRRTFDRLAARFRKEGFMVQRQTVGTAAAVKKGMADPDLHAYGYMGHGIEGTLVVDRTGAEMVLPGAYVHHRLEYMWLLACDSLKPGLGKKAFRPIATLKKGEAEKRFAKEKFISPWRLNISEFGFLIGYQDTERFVTLRRDLVVKRGGLASALRPTSRPSPKKEEAGGASLPH